MHKQKYLYTISIDIIIAVTILHWESFIGEKAEKIYF